VLGRDYMTPLLSEVNIFNGLNMAKRHSDVDNSACRMENYAEVDNSVHGRYHSWILTLAASQTSTPDQAACTNQREDTFQDPGIKCSSTFSR
jgi:hypothetical protein